MLIIVPAENNVPCYNFHNCMYMEISYIFHETYHFFQWVNMLQRSMDDVCMCIIGEKLNDLKNKD